MPSWIGPWEIIIIVVIILLIFGGRLLPRLGSSFGRSIVGLKKGLKEGEEEFKTAIKEDVKTDATTESSSAGTAPQVGDSADETKTEADKTERS